MNKELIQSAYCIFHHDLVKVPPMALRAGDAVDSYDLPSPYDEQLNEPNNVRKIM